MFTEPRVDKGWIEVICGSMFSGKTEELLRRLRRARIANQNVKIFKPSIDQRYDENKVVSHDSNATDSIPVKNASDIRVLSTGAEVVGLDETQFFDPEIVAVCSELADQGIRVIVAGLDMDFKGQPFGSMPELMAIAEYVTKVHAICVCCGNTASRSFRVSGNHHTIELGEKDKYEPRCRTCFNKGMAAQR